ncbi:MAG: XRE family transcriptional regulator [Microbacterium sp.]
MSGGTETEAAERLGAAIRDLRRGRGLTLAALAEATGLSHPFLSQVERGIHQPSLGSLRRIAFALETSPLELVAASEPPPVHEARIEVRRAGEGEVPEGFSSDSARMLAHAAVGFNPMEIEVTRDESGPAYSHDEGEFVYVTRGEVIVELDGVKHSLSAGDSTYYAGGVAHRWWAPTEPARLVVVKEARR